MAFIQYLFHITNFRSPLLRTLVPCVAAAFALQAAAAAPSIFAQTERFYDASGSATFIVVGLLSLYLPALRARAAAAAASGASSVGSKLPALPSLLAPFQAAGAGADLNWRQVALTGAVTLWTLRCESPIIG